MFSGLQLSTLLIGEYQPLLSADPDELYEFEPRNLLKRRKSSWMLDFLSFGGEDEILATQAQSDDELYEFEPRNLLKRRKSSLMLDFLSFGGEDEIRTRGRIAPTSV